MKKKRIAVGVVAFALAGSGYHFVFGYVESVQVSEQVSVLTRRSVLNQIGANVVVYVGETKTVIVDTQLAPFASSTRAQVEKLAKKRVATVIVTHWHPDHSGGIEAFSGDAEVVAHENVLKRLSAPQEGFGLTKPGSHHQFDAQAPASRPTRTVHNRHELLDGSATIDIVHYERAHTDGDLVIYFADARVVSVGDLIWPGSFPYIDVHNGGTVAGLESALAEILARSKSGDRFVPGHGSTQTFEEVRTYLEMVSGTRQWVEEQEAQGKSVDQIIAIGLPEQWRDWGSSLVPTAVWVEMIVASRGASAVVGQRELRLVGELVELLEQRTRGACCSETSTR